MPIELLAPAKNPETGKAAVNCGADAVYIGAAGFSARREAGNSVADIAALIEYAHRYMTRVYVALNTILLNDDEVLEAAKLLWTLYDAGVDGAIIQDMGLLEAGVPPMPIIASTQTHNASLESVQFLERVGFHRVILARELGIADIRAISEGTSRIELECFVHGALCMSYSGRCWLSAANGKRSANRGECAQPCRRRYRLEENGRPVAEGHLLSVKDLNRIDMLEPLLDAGVTSFKIEGRLKDTAYVINTVSAYRQALDDVLRRRGDGGFTDQILQPVTANLQKTFHRGYVTGFATGRQLMANFETPGNMGEAVGTVVARQGNLLTLELNHSVVLTGGDGLCFLSADGLQGTRVQKVTGSAVVVLSGEKIQVGMTLYRNSDYRFLQELEKASTVRRSPATMHLEWDGETLVLTALDAQGIAARVERAGPWEEPHDQERMRQTWVRQLKKSGDSEFVVAEVVCGTASLPFAGVGQINELRREVLETLRGGRETALMDARDAAAMVYTPSPFLKNIDEYQNVTNEDAKRFYLRCGATEVREGLEKQQVFETKKVMTSRYCLRRELGSCLLQHPEKKQAQGNMVLRDPEERYAPLGLRFDCEACEMSVIYENTAQSEN